MQVGDRVVVVEAAGTPLGGGMVAADPHPEHINKPGVITRFEDFGNGRTSPVIKLDTGEEVGGWECWWDYAEAQS